jgi:short-chain 2-methylacyl-CoA dehydrogenase
VARWDEEHHFPVEAVHAMGDLGLFGLVFPEEWGGGDGDFVSLCVAIEEIGRIDQSMGITLSAGVGLGANPIFRFGTEEQKQRWLPDLVAGRKLGAFGLTEPRRRAATPVPPHPGCARRRRVGHQRLEGVHHQLGHRRSPRSSPSPPAPMPASRTSSSPAGTPGMEIEPPYRKLGWHASDTHGIALADCRVPHDHLLGEPGNGFRNFLSILDDGRIAISALALGCARACLELSVEYAGERIAFDRPDRCQPGDRVLARRPRRDGRERPEPHVQGGVAQGPGRDIGRAAAIAKLYTTEAAVTATRVATQVFGGAGFIEESPVARFYRDAKILEIGEGTSEIQRLVIARELGLPVT